MICFKIRNKGTAVQASSAQSKVSFNEVWCNGSITDFGSVCSGSNPLTSTNANIADNVVIVQFECNIYNLNGVYLLIAWLVIVELFLYMNI